MVRHPMMIAGLAVMVACGGGGAPKQATPKKTRTTKQAPAPKRETEADREQQRQQAAAAIIPGDSTCLPLALKEQEAPRLELAAIGSDAVICAIDNDQARLLGTIGCWKVDLASGELAYRSRERTPGRGVAVKVDEGCARGFCVPKLEADAAHITTNLDGTKTAVLAGDEIHIFDTESKEHETQFSIRGDNGPTGEPKRLSWVADGLLVEASGDAGTHVWVFKSDGTAVGVIEGMERKPRPLTTERGSFSILDKTRVAISDEAFSTLTTYEVDTGKRAKYVRKLPKSPCKAAELDAAWKGGDGVSAKCQKHMAKHFSHLLGADAVAGSKNLLVLLRGPRLGELAVLDAKTLAEKKAIKLPWCDAGGGDESASDDDE